MDRSNFLFCSVDVLVRVILSEEASDLYVGLIVVIIWPLDDFIHSLLIKSPVGCVQVRPLGAVS